MGRIDPKLIVQGEESSVKVIKFRGRTSTKKNHYHDFVVYEDMSVEILPVTWNGTQHTHVYYGEYPHGTILEGNESGEEHRHKVVSVKHPIILTKQIFGKKGFSNTVNKDFGELFSSPEDKLDVEQFFKDFQEIFYEIPKSGEKSHIAIIKQSSEYVGDFLDERDNEITQLTKQVVDLEKKLAEQQEDINKEHPIFTNGSFLKVADNPTIYYMDKGAKRGITDYETYLILKRVNGHAPDKPDEEVYILVTEDVIKGLETGPKFSSEDLYGDSEQRNKEEEKKRVELDPDDFVADPSNYETTSDYIAALDRETRQLLAKEEYVQELYYRYKADSENVTDGEARAEATEKFGDIQRELHHLRRKILRYTDILETVDPDGDLKNLDLDISKLKSIVDEKSKRTEFSDNELRQLRHKNNRIKRFLDMNKPKNKITRNPNTQNSPSSTKKGDISGMLGAAGFGNVPSTLMEEMPKNPPGGFTPNPNNTVKNHTLEEAAQKMRLGARSQGGGYYWSLKTIKNKPTEAPKLENGKYKLWENFRPMPPGLLINPHTRPVSRHFWSRSHFEWVPMPGTLGIKPRTWHGKQIHKFA